MNQKSTPPLIGFAPLMRMSMSGMDAGPLSQELLTRAQNDPDDANALLDLSLLLQIIDRRDLALVMQQQALDVRQLYHLPAAVSHAGSELRLLSLYAPGDLMANTPLECLLEHSDVALDMLYITPGQAVTETLPDHDVLFVAICESDRNRPLLDGLAPLLADWPRPVLNPPRLITRTSRESVHRLLHDAPGILIPPTVRADRTTLARLAEGALSPAEILGQGAFPLIVRPVDAHGGHGLEKLNDPQAVAGYLDRMPQHEFHVSPFIDYRQPDGLYRKYRLALIDGRPYACHMGISNDWMIHYLNAGMSDSAEKRAEEERFMTGFDDDFGRRHAAALQAIAERMELDYLVIDCADAPDGRLLIFEVDTGAVVHAMDPVDLFPYKQPQMQKVFAAFRTMLGKAAQQGMPNS